MNKYLSFFLSVIIGMSLCAAYGQSTDNLDERVTRNQWVEKCLSDFSNIKPGMTRHDVDILFPKDGGLHGASSGRYVHPECPYFKIEVFFDFKRNPEDQNRAIMSSKDPVTSASKPYIEYPTSD